MLVLVLVLVLVHRTYRRHRLVHRRRVARYLKQDLLLDIKPLLLQYQRTLRLARLALLVLELEPLLEMVWLVCFASMDSARYRIS